MVVAKPPPMKRSNTHMGSGGLSRSHPESKEKEEEKAKTATSKKEKKGKGGKVFVPEAGKNKCGIYVLDSKKKKVYPMFQKLIFTDEKLKKKNAIAEREPNDSVSVFHFCYLYFLAF